ncbi:MAG: UDP-N-acetylmuramate dehydrogenase [Candidatus Improbicoccus devescovinae]|nr:MAG: UDP-N-acetylmuramate dehydrogenase [Candidatus Improbicoccus devescovinae]
MKYVPIIRCAENLGCRVIINESLKKYTSFKIGGPADVFINIYNKESLIELIKLINKKKLPFFVLGSGTNLVVLDKGYRGIVFKLDGEFKKLEIIDEKYIKAGSAVLLSDICVFAKNHGLTGIEFAYGIPGTCGGAIYMNAGAYDGEISQVIHSSSHIELTGKISSFNKQDFDFSYRKSNYTDEKLVIMSGIFELNHGDKTEITNKMIDYNQRRNSKQPLEYPSAGSIFKRPPGYFAGTLIQECGLKGASIGGAQVSEKHSGFIINKNNSSATDVLKLIEYVQNTVYRKTGVNLKTEVKFLGQE